MKKIFLALSLVSSLAFAHNYPNPITPQDAATLVQSGSAILIDVREKSEVVSGMAEPAIWYPKSSIDTGLNQFVDYLSRQNGKQIIIYCRSGHRASIVIQALAGVGVKASNMGGYQDWVAAGLPIKIPPAQE